MLPDTIFKKKKDTIHILFMNSIATTNIKQTFIMATPQIITVFGATGTQGGSVVDSLLHNKSGAFKIRGITRNSDSEKARELQFKGVEVVQADGLIKEQLVAAFQDSWAVFANTNSDDPVSAPEYGAWRREGTRTD